MCCSHSKWGCVLLSMFCIFMMLRSQKMRRKRNDVCYIMNICPIFTLHLALIWTLPTPEGNIWLFSCILFTSLPLTICLPFGGRFCAAACCGWKQHRESVKQTDKFAGHKIKTVSWNMAQSFVNQRWSAESGNNSAWFCYNEQPQSQKW